MARNDICSQKRGAQHGSIKEFTTTSTCFTPRRRDDVPPQRRRTTLPSVLLGLWMAILGASACKLPAITPTGTVRLALTNAPADISRVTVTVSGTGITEFTSDLTRTNDRWSVLLRSLPTGTDRRFIARAYNSSDALRYQGQVDNVTVLPDQTTVVTITLQDVNQPPPYINEAPIIDSLVATPTSTGFGGVINLQAAAHDPNGDAITVAWSAASGTFGAPSQLNTNWTAPAVAGVYPLTLSVSDPHGVTVSLSLGITVAATGDRGDVEVLIGFNTSPLITTIRTGGARIAVGQTTSFAVQASDPDGDPLTYSWSSDCTGSFDDASSATPRFTPTQLPASACNNCRVSVVVSDGHGGSLRGTLAICIVDSGSIANLPPIIGSITPGNPSVQAGQALTFEASASDPQDSALRFSWSANAGTLGSSLEPDANTSRIGWTAPPCVSGTAAPSVTVTVTNAFGLISRQTVVVTGLASCVTRSYTLLAGFPNAPALTDGVGSSARIYNPGPLVYDNAGHLYFVELGYHMIRRLTVATGEIVTLAGSTAAGYVDGTGDAARFSSPRGMSYDSSGYLYIADYGNHVIRRLELATNQVTTVVGRPGSPGNIDGPNSLAQFNHPYGVVSDGAGYLYITDYTNHTLRRFDLVNNQTSTPAGAIGSAGHTDGTGLAIRFTYPAHMTYDRAGHLFIVESPFTSIRRYDISGNSITTVAGTPSAGGRTDGVGTAARFNTINGIAFDGIDSFYIADEGVSVIRRFNVLTQAVTTVFGQAGNGNISIGDFNTASFSGPRQVAPVGPGTLVICDNVAQYFSIVRGLYTATP